jgi:putative heme-binding domain-containing protein
LLGNWRGHSPGLRDQILAVLLSRRDWTAAVLEALETGTLASADLDAATRSRLVSYRADEIRARAQKLLASLVSADREKVLADYDAAVGMKGNLIRGASAFGRRCATCHRFRGRGNEIGPNLAGLRDKSSRNLLIAVLDPNRAVERAYVEYVVATADGKAVNGMIVSESSNSFTIAQPNGQKHDILRADVEDFSGTGKSFMPEGLEKDFSIQELADVFAFLQSAPQPAGGGDTDAARVLLGEAGLGGLARVTTHPALKTLSTWLGEVDMPYVAAGRASQPLVWQSLAVPKAADGQATRVFRLPVAFGIAHQAGAANPANGEAGGAAAFQLAVNGETVLELPALAGDASQTSSDGRAVAHYLVMEQVPDFTSGVLEIELPGSLVSDGEPVEFSVAPLPRATSGWFGVLPVD